MPRSPARKAPGRAPKAKPKSPAKSRPSSQPASRPASAPPDPGRARSGTVDLYFRSPGRIAHVSDPLWKDVSCVAVAGRTIFCSCDETASLERLVLDPATGQASDHQSFALADAFDLPGGRLGEMDIEGMGIDGGYLWLAGSHSLKRDKPGDEGLAGLEGTDWDENRAFLGRVPVADRGDGVFEPMVSVDPGGGAPARTARMLKMKGKADKAPLRRMLADDPLIGPFVDLPCKENGFDIEGLAVHGDTVLLGLRGPVIGGFAILLRLDLKEKGDDRLKPRRLSGGRRYALQALDLGGHGIRDLVWRDGRLLILAGATTDIEAPQSVWAIEAYDPGREMYPAGEIERLLDLPLIHGADHAEGIDLIGGPESGAGKGGAARLLVTYDSPAPGRADPTAHRLTADLYEIAPPAG